MKAVEKTRILFDRYDNGSSYQLVTLQHCQGNGGLRANVGDRGQDTPLVRVRTCARNFPRKTNCTHRARASFGTLNNEPVGSRQLKAIHVIGICWLRQFSSIVSQATAKAIMSQVNNNLDSSSDSDFPDEPTNVTGGTSAAGNKRHSKCFYQFFNKFILYL